MDTSKGMSLSYTTRTSSDALIAGQSLLRNSDFATFSGTEIYPSRSKIEYLLSVMKQLEPNWPV
jgi:hypothetical protein